MNSKINIRRLVLTSMLLALAAVLALACAYIPFLNLPFGGGFTIASMLPIVLISYMFGTGWGLVSALVYSFIQLAFGAFTGGGYVISLFTIGSDDFMGYSAAVWICLIDYIIAYTLLGFGGIFRNKLKKTPAIVLGTVVVLSLRYLAHIVSGYIFFGTWAEWFFGQDGFYKIGETILSTFSGNVLGIIYSVFYNGLYMIPEIVITAVAAVALSQIKVIKKYQ